MTETAPEAAPAAVTPGQALHDSLRASATATFGLLVSDFATWDQVPQWQRDRLENAARDAIAADKAAGIAPAAPDPRLVVLDPAMLHKELRELIQAHERTLEEILKNTGEEPDMSGTPEDFAVRYVRHLEAETTRLACVIRDIHLRASDALKSAEDREADGESEDADPAYRDPPRADPSGHDPHQFPTVAELGGEKFAGYPSESGL